MPLNRAKILHQRRTAARVQSNSLRSAGAVAQAGNAGVQRIVAADTTGAFNNFTTEMNNTGLTIAGGNDRRRERQCCYKQRTCKERFFHTFYPTSCEQLLWFPVFTLTILSCRGNYA
ncbi:hypothetical protein HMPREF0880_03691 [Yokenella regensburgei ATCC 43003]|nr:hypothetical protein HMPREF0880_03691 [Yokenella regensburgei ATCC 43003]